MADSAKVTLKLPEGLRLLEPAALKDELRNVVTGFFFDLDRMLFGKGKELDQLIEQGKTGGTRRNWRPLSEKYLERKRRMMRTRAKVKPWKGIEPEPLRVKSTDVWARTGKIRDKVIRAKIGRSGKATGLREIEIRVNDRVGRYSVSVNEKLHYFEQADRRRPLLQYDDVLLSKAQALADEWVGRIGKDLLSS